MDQANDDDWSCAIGGGMGCECVGEWSHDDPGVRNCASGDVGCVSGDVGWVDGCDLNASENVWRW